MPSVSKTVNAKREIELGVILNGYDSHGGAGDELTGEDMSVYRGLLRQTECCNCNAGDGG